MNLPTVFVLCCGLVAVLPPHSLLGAQQASDVTGLDAKSYAARCTVEKDSFHQATLVKGPVIDIPDKMSGGVWSFIAMQEYGASYVGYGLQIVTVKDTPAQWTSARDSNGNELNFKAGSSGMTAQGVAEQSMISFTREYLEKAAAKKTSIEVYGALYRFTFQLTPEITAGFLKRCDQELGPIAPKTK